jgi:hypothetical protein
MNDSLHVYNPNAAAGDLTAIECPQCKTHLRLLRPATVHTPIACCICGATFYLQPVETAPAADVGAHGYGYPGRPGFRPAGPPNRRLAADRRPRSPDDPPPALTTPAPPPPTPGMRAAPGMPRPVNVPEHLQRNFRTRWLESVLGAALILLLVVGACAGGFMLLRSFWPRNDQTNATTAEADAPETAPDQPPVAPVYTLPKALPRPAALFGEWESRVDDGSTSTLMFSPDGKVVIAQAGDPPPPPFQGNWYLFEHKGDDLLLDVGAEFNGMSNTRIKLRMAGPDALTLVSQIRHGLEQAGGELRYIRVGPPPATPTVAVPEPADKAADKAPAKSQ